MLCTEPFTRIDEFLLLRLVNSKQQIWTSNWFEYGKGIIMMAFFPVKLSRIVGQADTEEKDDFQE